MALADSLVAKALNVCDKALGGFRPIIKSQSVPCVEPRKKVAGCVDLLSGMSFKYPIPGKDRVPHSEASLYSFPRESIPDLMPRVFTSDKHLQAKQGQWYPYPENSLWQSGRSSFLCAIANNC